MALLGAGNDQGGPVGRARFGVRGVDRRDVVTIDLDRVPSVCLCASREQVGMPLVHRGTALAQPVEVEDRDQVVDLVVRGGLHGFPDAALRHLGVTHEHPGPAGQPVEPHRQRHAEPDREALAQGATRDVDPRQFGDGRRVTLDRGPELPQREEFLIADRTDRLQHGVQGRRGVPLGHHEPVVRG